MAVSRLTADIAVTIKSYGTKIGQSFQDTSSHIQHFLGYMRQQAFSVIEMQQVFALFSDGLKKSCSGKDVEYFQNLQRTVWEVMENPGWIYYENNSTRNGIKNVKRLQKQKPQPTRSVALEIKILDQLVDLAPAEAQSNVLKTCTACHNSDCAPLITCDGVYCLNRYHYACVNLTSKKVNQMKFFFCQDCKKPKTKTKKRTSAPIPKQKPSSNSEQSKKRPPPIPSPVVKKKPRPDSAAATGGTQSTAVSSRAIIPTVSMPDALADIAKKTPSVSLVESDHVAAGHSDEDDCAGAQRSHLLPDADHGNCAVPKKPGGTAAIEQFQWSTLAGDNDICLATLESLLNGDSVDEDDLQRIEKSARRLLKNRCVAMCNLYHNESFLRLLEKAEVALEAYEGQEQPSSMECLEQALKQFGFVLTPRMWTRCELVLIMVLLIDPNYCYQNINQKRPDLDENLQNR